MSRVVRLEICVDTFEGASAAVAGGADRIELCSSLSEGGLTPSAGLMRAAAALRVPAYAMIRPRSGLFHFSEAEVEIMLTDIAAAREAGLAGVVIGAQTAEGGLDGPVLERLVAAAGDLGTTLHRVIDVVPDPLAALDQALSLGIERILTSGAQPYAPDGVQLIREMVQRAGDALSVMPGCGLAPDNVGAVVAQTGAAEVHAACRRRVSGDPAFSDFDPPSGRYETSASDIRDMKSALRGA
ncbi:MAG: copper homeostasis protein CutC [Pseudomonadota bacterium]